jgi:outer membrane protein
MKNLLNVAVLVLLAVAIAILFFLYLDTQNKYVYVDAQKLVNGYSGMKQARQEFEIKSNAWKSNLDTLRMEAEAKIKEYDSKVRKISAKEKELLEELIESKQQQYMNYQQAIAEKIKQEDQQLTAQVLTKVNDFIKRYGKEKGYTIIMAATQYGNIVYAKDDADITDEVLVGLNAEYGK